MSNATKRRASADRTAANAASLARPQPRAPYAAGPASSLQASAPTSILFSPQAAPLGASPYSSPPQSHWSPRLSKAVSTPPKINLQSRSSQNQLAAALASQSQRIGTDRQGASLALPQDARGGLPIPDDLASLGDGLARAGRMTSPDAKHSQLVPRPSLTVAASPRRDVKGTTQPALKAHAGSPSCKTPASTRVGATNDDSRLQGISSIAALQQGAAIIQAAAHSSPSKPASAGVRDPGHIGRGDSRGAQAHRGSVGDSELLQQMQSINAELAQGEPVSKSCQQRDVSCSQFRHASLVWPCRSAILVCCLPYAECQHRLLREHCMHMCEHSCLTLALLLL